MVQALERLLNLPTARISLVDWLGLFEVAAVRKRFGLSEPDMAQLHSWLSVAGVRWGLDAQHRQSWGIDADVADRDQNTWAFGLRRLLLGYAVGSGAAWGATLPQAAIRSLDAALVSKLLAWVDAITLSLTALRGHHTVAPWCALMAQLVERFFEASDDAEERQIQRLLEPLEAWQQACDEAQLTTPLALEVVREHWLSQLESAGLQQRFFGGGVQFGTLMPMRSIPFSAICLLGLNDGDYPRQTAPRDFDLMAHSWRPGDRSRREDDRYLFLEAILSARERLYISWRGHRATDNSVQPPSVLVAQLMDYLHAGWTPKREAQQQPLQAYSEAYFLQGSRFQTYDDEWARLHGGASVPGRPGDDASAADPTRAMAPAQTPTPQTLGVDDLRQLLRQPVEVFFRARLRIRFDAPQEAQNELEPFALNQLEKYHIGQSLLQATDTARALGALRLSGQLPLAAFGARQADTLARELDVVLERRTPWREKYPFDSPAVSIALHIGGVAVTGTLTGLWCMQDRAALEGTAAAANPPLLQLGQRLGAVLEGRGSAQTARGHIVASLWVNHLLACASGLSLTSVQLGLDGQVLLAPLPQHEAMALLETLVQVYQQAWLRPLPVACKTAWAYLKVMAPSPQAAEQQPGAEEPIDDAHEAAQAVFEGDFLHAGERASSPYLARAFDSYQDLEPELAQWSRVLYGALFHHASVVAAAETEEEGA
jgi:exodeoxyribonuclease V gamma subunit